MYKTEYDRSLKQWFAWYLNDDQQIDGGIAAGDTRESALVNLGWQHCINQQQQTGD